MKSLFLILLTLSTFGEELEGTDFTYDHHHMVPPEEYLNEAAAMLQYECVVSGNIISGCLEEALRLTAETASYITDYNAQFAETEVNKCAVREVIHSNRPNFLAEHQFVANPDTDRELLLEMANRYDINLCALQRALDFNHAHPELVENPNRLNIADMSRPAHESRFHSCDLSTGECIRSQVTHGSGFTEGGNPTRPVPSEGISDPSHCANGMENGPQGTNRTRPGFMLLNEERTNSRFGAHLRLDGLQPQLNGDVRESGVYMHRVDYAREESTRNPGRSFGCPGVPDDVMDEVIELNEPGSLFYFHVPVCDEEAHSCRYFTLDQLKERANRACEQKAQDDYDKELQIVELRIASFMGALHRQDRQCEEAKSRWQEELLNRVEIDLAGGGNDRDRNPETFTNGDLRRVLAKLAGREQWRQLNERNQRRFAQLCVLSSSVSPDQLSVQESGGVVTMSFEGKAICEINMASSEVNFHSHDDLSEAFQDTDYSTAFQFSCHNNFTLNSSGNVSESGESDLSINSQIELAGVSYEFNGNNRGQIEFVAGPAPYLSAMDSKRIQQADQCYQEAVENLERNHEDTTITPEGLAEQREHGVQL